MERTPHEGAWHERPGSNETVPSSARKALSFHWQAGAAAPPGRSDVRSRVTFWLLLGLWSFNICDFLLTREAIAMGRATEANGVMSYLLSVSTTSALVFKFGVVSAGVLVLWRLRTHHAVLFTAALLAAVFGTLVLYQAFEIASF